MGTRDRYGELVDQEDVHAVDTLTTGEGVGSTDLHDPRCVAGWLPDAPDGRAVPCLTCRPHLAHRHDHLHRQLEGPQH